jgi:hypothetical protein
MKIFNNNLILVTFFLVSFQSVFAEETPANDKEQIIENKINDLKKEYKGVEKTGSDPLPEIKAGQKGTKQNSTLEEAVECQKLSGYHWNEIIGEVMNNRAPTDEKYWIHAYKGVFEHVDGGRKADNDPDKYYALASQLIEKYYQVRMCMGFAALSTYVQPDEFRDFVGLSQTNVVSMDGFIRCSATGVETQDYKICVKTKGIYEGFVFAEVGMRSFQQVGDVQNKMNLQLEAAKNSTNPTAALLAQVKDIDKKIEQATQRMTFFTTKSATLLATLQRFPSSEKLIGSCIQILSQGQAQGETIGLDLLNKALGSLDPALTFKVIGDTDPKFGEMSPDILCSEAMQKFYQGLLLNERNKDTLKATGVAAGVMAGKATAEASILKGQKNKILALIKSMEDQGPSNQAVAMVDAMAKKCEVNPNDPACANLDVEKSQAMIDGGFKVVGNTGRNTAGTIEGGGDGGVDSANSGVSGGSGGAIDPFGRVAGDITKGSGLMGRRAPAASVKSKQAGGGGGGGGGAGGASRPSGGGVRDTGGDKEPPPENATGNTVKAGYGKGGGGSLTKWAGGRGRRKRKSGDGNVFKNLFKKKGTKKGGVLNFNPFQGIAQKDGKNIFEIISKRYTLADKKNRLIKYEKVKKKKRSISSKRKKRRRRKVRK